MTGALRPVLLHLDDALAGQPSFLADARAAGAAEVDARALGPALRLWSRPPALGALGELLDGAGLPGGPWLTFYGSGDFHHVSALLVARAAARAGEPVTVVHLDNHPDWVRFRRGLHCGSWAARAARMEGVDRVLTVGPAGADLRQPWRKGADLALVREGRIELYPLGAEGRAEHRVAGVSRPTVAGLGADAFGELLLSRVRTRAVYLTLDKDALQPADAATNWDQGGLSLAFASALIGRLRAERRLAGADVCGDWSRPVHGGGRTARLLKRAEAWLDQPRRSPPAAALAVNARANRALLRRFAGAE